MLQLVILLFVVFIMAWVLYDVFEKHTLWGCVIAVGSYGIGILGGKFFPNVFSVWTACRYLVFFWLGFQLRRKGTEGCGRIPTVVWIAIHGLLFAVWKYTSGLEGKLTLLCLALEFAAHITGALMAFVVLQRLAERFRWKDSSIMRFLERNAMIVYLFHQQLIYFVLALLNGVVSPYLNALLNFAVAMGVSLVLGELLRKFRITRCLVGENNRK